MLKVEGVDKSYRIGGWMTGKRQNILRNVSFECGKGECLGIIGESGSGKSTLGRLILGIEKPDSGRIVFEGNNVTHRQTRLGNISAVFQDYTSSINPYFTVEEAIMEPLRALRGPGKDLRGKIDVLLGRVGLDSSYKKKYPHELSGGKCKGYASQEPFQRSQSALYSMKP